MWLSLKCLRSSSRIAEMAFTMISLCRFTSTPSFMLCKTVVLQHKIPNFELTYNSFSFIWFIKVRQPSISSIFTLFVTSFQPCTFSTSDMNEILMLLPKSGYVLCSELNAALEKQPAKLLKPFRRLCITYGISSGSTSARMLMESVLALEVGAAASRILSRAI